MKTLIHTFENLNKHDLDLFVEIFDIDYRDIRLASKGDGKVTIEHNYVRELGFYYWNEDEGISRRNKIESNVKIFNSRSNTTEIIADSYSDQEEDDDRTWAASWNIEFKPIQCCPKCKEKYVYDIEHNLMECSKCLHHWKK